MLGGGAPGGGTPGGGTVGGGMPGGVPGGGVLGGALGGRAGGTGGAAGGGGGDGVASRAKRRWIRGAVALTPSDPKAATPACTTARSSPVRRTPPDDTLARTLSSEDAPATVLLYASLMATRGCNANGAQRKPPAGSCSTRSDSGSAAATEKGGDSSGGTAGSANRESPSGVCSEKVSLEFSDA